MAIFPNNRQTGFSLIEVMIFVSILSLFFVLALTVTVFSLRNLKENAHKIVAAHYLNQLSGWIAYEKERDWTGFFQKTGTYCFNNKDNINWDNNFPCSSDCPGGAGCLDVVYNRQATFSVDGNSSTVEMSISWNEINKQDIITDKTIFSLWEK